MSDIEIIHEVGRTWRQTLRETSREPTADELAEKLGVPLEKVQKALKIVKEPILLKNPYA
jgi:RNA polymerase primary sigma factor